MTWRLYVLYDSQYEKAYAKLHFGKSLNIRMIRYTGSQASFIQNEIMDYVNEWKGLAFVGVCRWDCNTKIELDMRALDDLLSGAHEGTDILPFQNAINIDCSCELNGFMKPTCMFHLIDHLQSHPHCNVTPEDFQRYMQCLKPNHQNITI